MSTTTYRSLIAGEETQKRERRFAIPWPLLSTVLSLALLLALLLLLRLKYLHQVAARAIKSPTVENRIESETYRGTISHLIGSEFLDSVAISEDRVELERVKTKKANALSSKLASSFVDVIAHNRARLSNLGTELSEVSQIIDEKLLATVNDRLTALPGPIALPDKITIRKLRSTTGVVSTLQFDVLDGSSKSLDQLSIADVSVTDTEGRDWPLIAIDHVSSPLADHSIVVLVDKSSSMAGDRLVKLQAALDVLIANCSSSTRLAIIGFDSKVVPLSVFTNDHRVLSDATKTIVADGATEITKALDYAIKELSNKPGYRTIVLCTDGQDNNLASNMKRIVDECDRSKISISVLGLNDPTLDKTNLANIAKATHGQFCLADNPLAISEQMQRLIGSYSKPSYRVFVFNPSRKLDRFRFSLVSRPDIFIDVIP
jgi:uncharacterized protein YegL